MIYISAEKKSEDDIRVPGGYVSLENFNRMKGQGRIRFISKIRKFKIERIFSKSN